MNKSRDSAPAGNSTSADQCLEQAQFYFKQGKFVEAREWLQRMLDIAPNELKPLVAYGNLSFQFGEMFAAADAFGKAAKLRPNDAALQALLATAAYRAGQVDVFKAALGRALELDAKNVAALQLLANLNLSQGNLAGAAKIYFKILREDANNVEATFGLGVCFFNQSNKDMARQSFERVLKLQPDHGLAQEHLLALKMSGISDGLPDTRSTLLIHNYNYNACSAGIRAVHYLAMLLRAANVPVAVTHRCFYNPTIPIRSQAMPDDIAVYPDASRGNILGARRLCRYMFYYAHAYFGGDRITEDECAIVFHRVYLADVQAHCDYALTEDDIFTIPILDKEWCFPEEKTIENVLYVGKGKGKAPPNINCMPIAAATAPQNHNAAFSDHYAHMRTLAVLRKAKNFYTMDENTLMSSEAALCGCKVFFVKDANTFEEQTRILEEIALPQVMSPERDIQRAWRVADRIYRFFEKRTAAQRKTRTPSFAPRENREEKAPVLPPKPPRLENPEVSIIIPTFNKLELTRQCLRALRAGTPAPSHEIIVVDNGSTDGTREFLQAEESAGGLRAILNAENVGFAKACNQGARAARGRYVAFLNNDTEPQPNWLGPLFSLAEGDSAIAVTGSKLLYPNGTIQHAGVALADCWDHDPLLAFHLFAKEKADFPLANQRRVYQAVTAACMLARKTCFDAVGGFDEEYWNGYEDVDLCLRFHQRGWLAVYEPASVVIHHESQSGPERFRRAGENIERFHRKWLEHASPDVIIDQDGKTRISESSVMRLYSPPPGKLISIILLAHNQLADTRQCLASIEKHTPLSHELILVDNGSTDGTGQFFRQYAAKRENVRVILNRANLGFSAGNNQALACAKGDAILLLNNDTVVTPGWLEQMLSVLELYPECGLAGPMSNSVSGPQLVSSANYGSLEELPKFAHQWSAAHAGQSTEAPRLVGFCLLLRRAVLEKIGGFDAQFGNGNFEDDDFCVRALLSGFKLRIAHASFVHHTGGQTFKGAKIDYRASMTRNWELFKAKWGMPKEAPLSDGYRVPSAAPAATPLHLPPPALDRSHVSSGEGRCWTDKTLPETVVKKSHKPAVITLPPCALIGQLNRARDLAGKKQWPAAWQAATDAILSRPYHPEAYALLGEIALRAGAGETARQCAQKARDMAPGWAAPKKFLKGNLRGNARPEWLKIPPVAGTPRISVCLITKNEEKFLGRCLRSVQSVASQIIVMDTGSTDRTVEIAKQHGAEVHSFAWRDDFAAARNAALEHANGDWILILDADEELMPGQGQELAREIQVSSVLGYRIPIIDAGREVEGCGYVPRLFRNAPGLFFVGRIHEQAFSSIQVRCQQWGLKHQIGKTRLLHHGYTDEVLAGRKKIERNLSLLRRAIEELPGEPNLVMSLGLELVRSGQLDAGIDRYWEAFHLLSALPPGQVTPELKETLLTQLTTHLMTAKRHSEVAQLWQIPFAKAGGMTASQHFSLGLAYIELKQPAQAAEQMQQCLERRNQPVFTPVNRDILNAAPHHCLALCLTAINRPEDARKAFEAALAEEPSSRNVRFDYARFHASQGAPIDALKLLNQLTVENPAEARVWQFGGQIALSRQECRDFARHWTSHAIKHYPKDPAILTQRAEALMLNQDIEQALALWRNTQAPATPRQRAAILLCEFLAGDRQHQIRSDDEPAVSREALHWYRQWISVGAHSTAHQLHERMEQIRLVLPGFVRVWEAADRQARKVAA